MSETTNQNDVKALRLKAANLHASGNSRDAVRIQLDVVNAEIAKRPKGDTPISDYNRLGMYSYYAGDYRGAAEVFLLAHKAAPNMLPPLVNLGNSLIRLGEHQKAGEALQLAHKKSPDDFGICDSLTMLHGKLGDTEQMREFGNLALTLKDQAVCDGVPAYSAPASAPPPFNDGKPKENVISFSLWGNQSHYTEGAVENAKRAPDLYPAWTCRFHVDETVTETVIKKLQAYGAEIRKMRPHYDAFEGLFWRFSVADDPGVKRFLIRDCDSVINTQERIAVDNWIGSGKHFHLMRDYFTHTELILAGMWGGVTGVLLPMDELKQSFLQTGTPQRTTDQVFLRELVWPRIKHSCLIHDSQFTVLGAEPFPLSGRLPHGQHVGENEMKARELGRR